MHEKKLNPYNLISTYLVGNEINKYQERYITMYELNPPKERTARKISFASLNQLAETLYEFKTKYNSQFIFNASKKVKDKTISAKDNIEGLIDSIERTTGIKIDELTKHITNKKMKEEFEKLLNSGRDQKFDAKIIIPGSEYKPFSKNQMNELKHYLTKINEDVSNEIFDVIISKQ